MLKVNAIYELIEKMEREFKSMPTGVRNNSDVTHENVIQWAGEFASLATKKDFTNFETLVDHVAVMEGSFERVVHCTLLVILFESNDINKREIFERINEITKDRDWAGYFYFSNGMRYINAMLPSVAEPMKDYIAKSEAYVNFFINPETSTRARANIISNLNQYYGASYTVNGYQRIATFLKRVVKKNNGIVPEISTYSLNGMLSSFISFAFDEKPKLHEETLYQFSGAASESMRRDSSSRRLPEGTISMFDIMAYEIFKVPVENRLFDHPHCFLQNFDILAYKDEDKCAKMFATVFSDRVITTDAVEAHLLWYREGRDMLEKEYGRALVSVLIRYFNICNLINFF